MSYNIHQVDTSNVIDSIQHSIDIKETCAYFMDDSDTFAFVPMSWNDDERFAEYGIKGYKLFYDTAPGRGTIIVSPGDLSFLVMRPYDDTKSICDEFEQHLLSFIKSKFADAELSGNDILVNGKKIIGTASNILDGMTLFMFMASYNNNEKLISSLCSPGHDNKTPYSIDSSILSKEEFKNEITSWLA